MCRDSAASSGAAGTGDQFEDHLQPWWWWVLPLLHQHRRPLLHLERGNKATTLSKNQRLPGCPTSLFVAPFGLQRFWVTPCTSFLLLVALGRGTWGHIPAKNAPWADVAMNPDLLQNMTCSCVRIFRSKHDHGQSSGQRGDGNAWP